MTVAVIVIIILWLIWQWIQEHILISILSVSLLLGGFIWALYKIPEFKEFMFSEFWMKIWELLRPPDEADRGYPSQERLRQLAWQQTAQKTHHI